MSNEPHKIFVCTVCRHKGQMCQPGYALVSQLKRALQLAVPVVGDDFEVSGTADIESCSRGCTVAYKATGEAIYLFGDIDAGETDIEDLVDYARRYRELENGYGGSSVRHGMRWTASQGRIPAAMIVSEADGTVLS
ncbi:DUF1636 domain-containing protein [Stappia sp. BW2]|uniref:DUF1636 family protein n=1 Tax=Stappia sp. BW2 TaxID=2592622 RepID=UPI0011DE7857|nr:DUF1636 family protein [Stappia sp. BW2]TYC65285.1 DUF1636 domain-containing protein [Stappia sp. BW2]